MHRGNEYCRDCGETVSNEQCYGIDVNAVRPELAISEE
jgi:hypothetical protein